MQGESKVRYSIEYAIEFERLSSLFYMQMAHRLNDHGDLRELFMALAIDENVHEKQLRKLAETLPEDSGRAYREHRLSIFRLYSGAKLVSGTFATAGNWGDIGAREGALERACDFEKNTLEYYRCFKDALGENPIIEQIISFEKCHLVKINQFIGEAGTRSGFDDKTSGVAVG